MTLNRIGVKNQQNKCEPNPHFRVHIGEGKPHFAFNLLLINKIRESGEEVKTKKRKTADARAREEIPEFAHEKERMGGSSITFKKIPFVDVRQTGLTKNARRRNTTLNGLRLPFEVVYAIFVDDNNANDAV